MTEEALEIHPERMSEKAQVFEGTADLAELYDLADTLANTDGELRYKVTAVLEPGPRKVVSCIIEGFVFLMCQKTLEAFRHEIRVCDRLILVDSESELPPIEEENDVEDYVVVDGPIDVRDLVDEAVLLALPMVPRKPGLEDADSRKPEGTPKESPFAALERLKKKTD
ncbi:MAG TPA: YceD family protein [Usitatibacter sp.]|nr:YceD family protein [Usitatibacter sp.]